MTALHRVVIIGGGFGGLNAAKALRRDPVSVTLIDRRNFHLFQPLLYQVATGGLSPADIAAPLRSIFKRQRNTKVLLGEVDDFDVERREVILSDGERLPYDSLIVATGVRHDYFGNDQWERSAPGLKTVEDATEIRRRVLLAFEAAERETDPERVKMWLTFVIVGAGPTGVELAGAIAEIAHYTLRHNFRSIDPSQARIILVEGMDRVLTTYPPRLSQDAANALKKMKVSVMTGTNVTAVQDEGVALKHNGETEFIPTHTALWAAGVKGSPLGRKLAEKTGAPLDRVGRVIVEPDVSLPGHPEIFVIGDTANFSHQDGKPLPGVAQTAIQQGKYAAKIIAARARGEQTPPEPFHYADLGSLATIGRAAAVANFGWIRFSGFLAWLMWLFIHLMNLVEFENRVLVFYQWAFSYFTRNRSARLITGHDPFPLIGERTAPTTPGTAAPAERPEPVEIAR